MSSKVSTSSASIGHATSITMLNGIRAATSASVSNAVSALNTSPNAGSLTDRSLDGGDDYQPQQFNQAPNDQDNASSVVTTDGDMAAQVHMLAMDNDFSFISSQEIKRNIGVYEQVSEQTDSPVPMKKTQAFG